MIDIVTNDNQHVAEAPSLEAAIVALRTLVPEEECDLRAVGEDGAVLAVGFYDTGVTGSTRTIQARVVTIQGERKRHLQQVHPRPFMPTRLDERD